MSARLSPAPMEPPARYAKLSQILIILFASIVANIDNTICQRNIISRLQEYYVTFVEYYVMFTEYYVMFAEYYVMFAEYYVTFV